MSKTIKYTDALLELEQIIQQIETNEVSIDELSAKVNRATSLIEICKKKLFDTEENVNAALQKLNQHNAL